MGTAEVDWQARIRTPDQRLRVFVSSTLQELAPERKAARRAIERLSAAPVMFELGARPHPPRSLYRAYLEQSDIFVGIYWEKYGWVAPGETVSGLEDEYNLAPVGIPKLMYFKEPKGTREPGLEKLLARIRDDDTASYKHFRDAKELARLLVTDLAVLLAERFDDSRAPNPATAEIVPAVGDTPAASLPAPLTRLYGREQDVSRVADLLRSSDVRLVTLTGPGGIGKTRLAIETARALTDELGQAAFIPLAPVDDPAQVPNAIAQALGVLDTGDSPLEQKLTLALSKRRILLVLDNFEQIVDAAPLVSRLLAAAPGVKVLVTSRVLLKITGEHSYSVQPLELPAADSTAHGPDQPLPPSVDLFIERARSVKPDLDLGAENLASIEQIVTRLEGVPLAIELAAARTRLLAPPTLLDRLQHQLPILSGGHRDAPARQRAVRDTIEWSTHLLKEDERDMLWRLGVFAGRFSLEAAEAVATPSAEVIALLEALVDASLIRQHERSGGTYFQLLATVREYALEQLDAQGLAAQVRDRHAHYYAHWAVAKAPSLIGPTQLATTSALSSERDNLVAAVRRLLDNHQWDLACQVTYALHLYWWLGGFLGAVRAWMDEVVAAGASVSPHSRAMALWLASFVRLQESGDPSLVSAFEESATLFAAVGDKRGEGNSTGYLAMVYSMLIPPDLERAHSSMNRALTLAEEVDDPWNRALVAIPAGRIELAKGDMARAGAMFEEALRLSEEIHDDFALTFPLFHLGWVRLLTGDVAGASGLLERALNLAVGLGHEQGIAYELEGFLGVAAALGDVEKGGLLYGAALTLREHLGLFNPRDAVWHAGIVDEIRNSDARELFEEAVVRGRALSRQEAIALARSVAATASAASGTAA